VPIDTMVSDQCYCALSQEVGPAVRHKKLELVSFYFRKLQHSIAPWRAKSGATSGLGGVDTSSRLPDLVSCECWLFACVKEYLCVNDFNRKMITTLQPLPLYVLWARTNTELQLIGCKQMGKACGQSGRLRCVEDVCVNVVECH